MPVDQEIIDYIERRLKAPIRRIGALERRAKAIETRLDALEGVEPEEPEPVALTVTPVTGLKDNAAVGATVATVTTDGSIAISGADASLLALTAGKVVTTAAITGKTGLSFTLTATAPGRDPATWSGTVPVAKVVVDPDTLPAGYRPLGEFPSNAFIYPTWEVGPESYGNPSLITRNADGSVTLVGQPAAAGPGNRTWATGAIQHRDPKLGIGRFGAVVHARPDFGVAAVFAWGPDFEVDFERTKYDGVIAWSPTVHVRGADGQMRMSGIGKTKRGPWRDARQVLEARIFTDRIDWLVDGVVFATVRPSDIPGLGYGGKWSASGAVPPMDVFLSCEKHTSSDWACWGSHTGKRIEMQVFGLMVEPGWTGGGGKIDTPEEPPVTATSSVGANLDGAFDYTTAQWAADRLKLSRTGWSGASASAIAAASDADGYLLRMPDGANAMTTYALTELPPGMTSAAGRYRLRWRGKGRVEIGGQTITATGPGEAWIDYRPTGGNWPITYRAIDAADPLRLMDLVHERDVAAYDAGDILASHHLGTLGPLGVLRMMDLGATNGSPLARWADRPRLSNRTWTSDRGVPLEAMIALCNRNASPMWYCIPHLADDDYVTRAATLIRDTLDPDLPVYVEYSNEVWNYHYAFGQTPWVEAQGRARWPGIDAQSARAQWAAGRTVQIKRIFDGVFGAAFADRVRMILGGHQANTWAGNQALRGAEWQAWDRANGGDGQAPAKHVYGYAIAAYFGYSLQDNAGLKATLRDRGVAAAVDEGIAILNRDLDGLAGQLAENKALCDQHGVAMVMYEGGLHANPMGSARDDAAYLDLLFRIHRDPRMAPLHKRWLDVWKAAGGREACFFSATSRWTKDGMWGFKEHDDDLAAPRWAAVTEWAEENPVWY